jgi:hypothetical protein
MKVIMNFDCVSELEFEIDKDMMLETVETKNVYDFKLLVNGELMNLDNEIKFIGGDNILVRISKDNLEEKAEVVLVGYDPETVVDTSKPYETVLDEPIDEEDILINPNEEELI